MLSRSTLGWLVVGWTVVVWGGRMRLLTIGRDVWDVVRLAGSIGLGLGYGWTLIRGRNPRLLAWGFLAWTAVIWGRALTRPGTSTTMYIHLGLAVGSVLAALLTLRDVGSEIRRDGDAGDA